MKYFSLIVLTVVAFSAELLQAARTDIIAERKKHNLFDPIYAFDDIDAHTVSLTSSSSQQQPRAAETNQATRAKETLGLEPAKLPITKQPAVQLVASFVASKKNQSSAAQLAKGANQKRASSLAFEDLVAPKAAASERPKFEPPVVVVIPETKAALSSSPADSQYDLSTGKTAKPAERHHWSGLENYYKMLQQQRQQQPQSVVDATIYQISQQPAYRDDQLGWTGGQPSWQQQQPIRSGPILMSNYNAGQPTNQPQSSFLFPYDRSYAPSSSSAAIKGHQITADNPQQVLVTSYYPTDRPLVVQSNVYDRDTSREDLRSLSREELLRLVVKEQSKNRQQQQTELRRYPTVAEQPASFLSQDHYNQERQPFVLTDGRAVQHEPTKLQEFMDIQRQQQRYRHQQETLGSIYDSQRMREQYQEEIYCRARNQVNIRLAPGSGANQTHLSPEVLSRLAHLRLDPSGSAQQEVTVQLSAAEFPSHMGIYNGTPGEDNFLCAATWIHDGFALTLATCVDSINPKILTARLGEWNLDKPATNKNNSTSSREMLTIPIKEIIIFPKYNKNTSSLEHNLALLKFNQPINFLQHPYASPACQRESRNYLQRAKSCWTPVRNITLSEYFDAEGEGETKEKKNVAMIELPVKLIADDDAECLRQSGVELFNFNHPNYICSADYRRSPWRAKLNQSDYFGSGIYCNEGGNLSLVSLLHPISKNTTSAIGYIDLSYYRPWMRSIIFAQTY